MLHLHEEMIEWTTLVARVVENHNDLRPAIQAELEDGRIVPSTRERLEEALRHFNVTVGDALLELQEQTESIANQVAAEAVSESRMRLR